MIKSLSLVPQDRRHDKKERARMLSSVQLRLARSDSFSEFYSTFQFSRRTIKHSVLTPNYAAFHSTFQFLRRSMQRSIQHSSSYADLCSVLFNILVLTQNYAEFYSTFQFLRRTRVIFNILVFTPNQCTIHNCSSNTELQFPRINSVVFFNILVPIPNMSYDIFIILVSTQNQCYIR